MFLFRISDSLLTAKPIDLSPASTYPEGSVSGGTAGPEPAAGERFIVVSISEADVIDITDHGHAAPVTIS